MARATRAYGCWPSPVSAELAAGQSVRFEGLVADGDSVFWIEGRPDQAGRCAIMQALQDGSVEEILPPPWSARSRVHEYGGGALAAHRGGVWFVEAETQDIYALDPGKPPKRLTQAPDLRFADVAIDSRRKRIVCVGERHAGVGHHPENFLASVALEGGSAGEVEVLVSGRDFYTSPRISPDGTMLAWAAWDLPFMPWEAAELYMAGLSPAGRVEGTRQIAGGKEGAVFQPEWTDQNTLVFVCDEAGQGGLFEWDGNTADPIAPGGGDLMRPQWAFGMRSYALLGGGRIAAAGFNRGEARLDIWMPDQGRWQRHADDLRSIDNINRLGEAVTVIAATDWEAPSVRRVYPGEGGVVTLRGAPSSGLAREDTSRGQPVTIPCDGPEEIPAVYYPPANKSFKGPESDLPPAIVRVHGGPTGSADRGFKLRTQFWTTRGFAVCDVDYSGSTGYGRAYRRRLDGRWGQRDVDDVVAAAAHLGSAGLADPHRLLISGGSAGGFTVLLALSRHRVFAAGSCTYGVCDLAQLQRVTHKFEAGYLYGLTGTEPGHSEVVFAERSPLNLAHEISAPVIFFQGSEDNVVPAQQTRAMAEALNQAGVLAAYHEFEGEGHGFRRADTLTRVLELEYEFYASVLNLDEG